MRDRICRLIPSIAAISIAIAASSARAQGADSAEELFAAGDQLAKSGKLAEACDKYEASNHLDARAGTLIRIGDCRERLQQLASAWSAYTAAVARAKDPQKRQLASTKVAELEPKLSHLTVTSASAFVVTRDGSAVDISGPLDGGDYTITAGAWTQTVTLPIANGDVRVEIPAPVIPPPQVVAQAEAAKVAPTPLVVAQRDDGGTHRGRTALWIGIGAAVLAGSAAIYWATRPGESCSGSCIDFRKP